MKYLQRHPVKKTGYERVGEKIAWVEKKLVLKLKCKAAIKLSVLSVYK